MATDDAIFREYVNSLPPEVDVPSAPKRGRRQLSDGTTKVTVQRVKTIIYIYTDRTGGRYGEQSFQTLNIIDDLTLAQALEMFKKEQERG